MSFHPLHAMQAGLLWALCVGAGAQQPPAAPASAPAAAPPAERSAFEGYRAYAEPPATGWRQANDTVGRIGGWRAYAREAQAAQPESAPAHDHHHDHGGAR
ncbi:MAG: hypothetical protein QM772_11770 [Ottowia sp.]|uniref:hypothetical protein n=1 Tax=Ottowia sp. TaxID=1898956 RepID=UPI0039E4C977